MADEDWRNAQDAEKSIADAADADGFDTIFIGQSDAITLVDLERGEDFVTFFPIVIIGDGEIAFFEHLDRFEDTDEARWIAIGERLEKSGVYEREDGDAGGPSAREDQDRGGGGGGVFGGLAGG